MEIKDKPQSMSVREWITRKLAQEVMIPEKTIRQVIAHQFDSAYEALNTNNSIEISGFGKFFYNKKKAVKEKEWLLGKKDAYEKVLDSETATEKERLKAERDIRQINDSVKAIENKL
jgi:nucleoid DNA-binding protein